MTDWDVVVIGAGVAGSTAAVCLAQSGLRVLILEKGGVPRHKVCGEFLSPEGASVLQRLGVWPEVASQQPQPIHTLLLSVRKHEVRCPLTVPGWGIRRWTLDRLLWEHARSVGATARLHNTVQQVTGDFAQGFTVTVRQPDRPEYRVRARAVICAAGRSWRQSTSKRVLRQLRPRQYLGVKAHVPGVSLDGCVELHTLDQGYCGLAEVDGGMTTVCCWVASNAFRHAGGTPDRLLARALAENPHLQRRLRLAEGVNVPWITMAYAPRRPPLPVEDGIWKIGDSVAMIAPLTGDGMGMGMQGAERAATLLVAGFRNDLGWAEASLEYERCWRREFWSRVGWGRRLETILRRPWLASLACLTLGAMPSLMNAIYHRTRDLNVSVTR